METNAYLMLEMQQELRKTDVGGSEWVNRLEEVVQRHLPSAKKNDTHTTQLYVIWEMMREAHTGMRNMEYESAIVNFMQIEMYVKKTQTDAIYDSIRIPLMECFSRFLEDLDSIGMAREALEGDDTLRQWFDALCNYNTEMDLPHAYLDRMCSTLAQKRMQKRTWEIKEELVAAMWHPSRVAALIAREGVETLDA